MPPEVAGTLNDPAFLLATLPDSVIVITPAQEVRYLNRAAEELFRRKVSDGLQMSELFAPGERLLALLQTVIKTGARAEESDVVLAMPHRPDVVFTSIQLLPVISEKLDVNGIMLVISPPPQFAHRQPFALMENAATMAAILGHEIKNPLAAIRAAAQHLDSKVGASDKAMTGLIGEEVERIRHMLDEMEIFSQSGRIPRSAVNPHRLLRLVLEASGHLLDGVTIEERYDPSLPDLLGNEKLLLQALRNIVKNAVEAMDDRPTLTLRTAYHAGEYVHTAEGERRSTPLVIEIADNGLGVPADIRPRLFEPFVSRKASGRGLGLAIVAKIVADHDGVIEYRPGESGGSVFRIRLPIAGKVQSCISPGTD